MATTIRDVARRLNLSITTVSRALDGYPDVSAKTREEVIRIAGEMGYVPNVAARQLRRHKADAIGYILPSSKPTFIEPFYSEFVAGLGDEAPRSKYDLLISSAPPESDVEHRLYQRWVQGRKVDGFILNRTRLYDWRMDYLSEMGFPFVGLERPFKVEPNSKCAFIEVDSQQGFRELIAHLVSIGHRRIAYIGGPENLRLQAARFSGYLAGLTNAGLPHDPNYILFRNLTSQGGYEAALHFLNLPEPPTAITCVNDTTAMGVLHAAHARGIRVGHDLAVAGFDGNADSMHTQPPLTTMNQPLYQIAGRMVHMLMALISGELLEERVCTIRPELIIRASTAGE